MTPMRSVKAYSTSLEKGQLSSDLQLCQWMATSVNKPMLVTLQRGNQGHGGEGESSDRSGLLKSDKGVKKVRQTLCCPSRPMRPMRPVQPRDAGRMVTREGAHGPQCLMGSDNWRGVVHEPCRHRPGGQASNEAPGKPTEAQQAEA